MKKLLLVLSLVASTMVGYGIQSGHALTNGVEGTDPSDDVMTSIEALRNRGLYARQRPYVGQFDIRNWSLQATNILNVGRRVTMSIKTVAPWPQPDAAVTTPEGAFPTGVTVMDIRWVYQLDPVTSNVQTTRQITGQNCTAAQQTVTNPVDDQEKWHPITYDKSECFTTSWGPFPQIDGWSFFLGVNVKIVGGKATYTWSFGRSGALPVPVFAFNEASTTHDQLSCWDVNLNGGQGGYKPSSACTPKPTAPPHGELTVDRVNSTITLRVPYIMRADLDDDEDGVADEERAFPFMAAGNQVATAQVHTAGTIQARVPPDEVKPCYKEIFSPIKDATGQDLQAILPAPFNDPNGCLQTGAGLTFTADWAPGNPFVSAGISSPFPSFVGDICVGTACNPDWGSFTPRVYPRALSYYPGLNAPFCRYPVGYIVGIGNAVTTRDITSNLKGITVDPPPDGNGTHIPAILMDPSALDVTVNLPTGTDDPCYHIRDNNGLFFINWGGAFTAG